jgi:hypothetical protein
MSYYWGLKNSNLTEARFVRPDSEAILSKSVLLFRSLAFKESMSSASEADRQLGNGRTGHLRRRHSRN